MNDQDLKNFKKELADLLEKYNCDLEVTLDGDTHCLTTNFVVSDNRNWEAILNRYETWISASDLRD
jgi:hypothetical protein